MVSIDSISGGVNLLKPPMLSSGGAVGMVRRALGGVKTGHGGTLDPNAAGVLPVLVGKSTRLSDYIMGGTKVYRCEAVFGIETDTCDFDGEVTRRSEAVPSESELRQAIAGFVGSVEQTPPIYSAIKVDGRKLYDIARRGGEVEIPKRTVEIYSIAVIARLAENRWLMEVTCGKGTYIRSLVRDIGTACGSAATVALLVRRSTGNFSMDNAFTPDEVKSMAEAGDYSFILPPEKLVRAGRIDVAAAAEAQLQNGIHLPNRFWHSEGEPCREGLRFVYCNDRLIGMGAPDEAGLLKVAFRL